MQSNETLQEPVFDGDGRAFDKGSGFSLPASDSVTLGHLALKRGRFGEWIAGMWLQHHGFVVAFGAAGSSHDLIATHIQTDALQSVQVKTTTKRFRQSENKGQNPVYCWRLKASLGQKKAGVGSWDAAKSDRLILIALHNCGKVWVLDSEKHYLPNWETQMQIKILASDIESQEPFITIGGDLIGTMFVQEDFSTEIEPGLFD